jgi:multidrug efflux pump subunit AcrB
MIEATIRRGTLLAVTVLIICMLGLVAALRIPVQMIPDLEVSTIEVDTRWPGATPQDMEKEILIEQERYLRALPNLRRMTATAETGRATIELEFPFGVDVNDALVRVNNALSQVPEYPENVDQPRLSSSSFSENAFMFFVIAPLPGNPRGLDMDLVRDFLDDNVRPRMERVSGVSQVDINGGAERQVRIEVDSARLAERGISATQLRNAIRMRNSDTSAGDLDSGKRRYLVRTVGRFDTLADMENLIIARAGDSVVRLKDVATVTLDHFELRDLNFSNGQPSLRASVRREAGSNVIDIKNEMMPEVEAINRELLAPAGMQMTLSSDDVRYVQDAIVNVWTNLIIGALLATAVMWYFLRSASATVVAVIGIPVCTIAAFIGLLLAGRTINVISLAGVAFALGMTVDNTIVVLESIEQHRRRGLARLEAAVMGVREVWPAVLASTLTTVLVFAPVLFITQEAGQLYSDIAIAISASILVSLLVAVTVVPTASMRLNFSSMNLASTSPLYASSMRVVDWVLATRRRRIGCIAGTLVAVLLAGIVLSPPAEYLPEGEEPKIFANMYPPPGYNLESMLAIAEELQPELMGYLDDDPDQFARGETRLPALKYFNLQVNAQRIWVLAEPKEAGQVGALLTALEDRFRAFPGMRAFASRGSIISSNDGGTRSVNLDISGNDIATLYRTADAALTRAVAMFDRPQIRSDPSSLSLDQPLLELRPRWDRLAELGLTAEDFGFAAATLSDGAFVDEFILEDDKIDIFAFSKAGSAQKPEALVDMPVHAGNGRVATIGSLADIVETVDTDVIRRVDGRRTVTLNVIPPRSVALETAVERVTNEMLPAMRAAGEIPFDVSIDISGAADQLEATRAAASVNFVVALVICYLLLVAIFTHWGYPLLIMTTVPLGLACGIVGLALMNGVGALLPLFGAAQVRQPFDMITMLGFLILLGTVVNNPILIVDLARARMRDQGMSPLEAVREAVSLRLRPILMTTFTATLGLAPLVFMPGAGTELYRGVGAIILFGLLFSTIIALTYLPCLFVVVQELRERWLAQPAAPVTGRHPE